MLLDYITKFELQPNRPWASFQARKNAILGVSQVDIPKGLC